MTTATKKKNKALPQSVETLRKLGFKVRVYHARYYHASTYNLLLSKKQAADRGLGVFGYSLSCHRGYTRVDITTPDHVELSGKYNFGNRQFDRKLGLRAAIGRAFTGRRSRSSI